MRISDWSSDVCSSDLLYRLAEDRIGERQVERQERLGRPRLVEALPLDALVDDLFRQVQGEVVEGQRSQHEQQDGDLLGPAVSPDGQIGRTSWRERVCQYVLTSVVAVYIKKKNNVTK